MKSQWKSPQQVTAAIERRLDRTWAAALAGTADESDWPHAFPIGQPAGAELASSFPAFVAHVTTWRAWAAERGLRLTWRNRRVHGTDQELPAQVVVPDVDAAAAVCGSPWPERLRRGRHRAAVLAERYPHLEGPARTLFRVDDLTDVDFDLLCRAADWFASHEATGLTPRQVPIAGLHAKWLNTRQHLVRELAGVDDLRLLPPHPARIHCTYLDPAHRAAGGRLHDSATVGDTVVPAYPPRVVVISENKDTALHFPELPGGISVEGVGRGGSTAAGFGWLVDAPAVFYWGDMDADGLEILDGFRAAGVPARSLLMNPAAFDAWERFGTNVDARGRPLEPRDPRPVPHLTADEAELYSRLIAPDWTRYRRIEQERIPLPVALAVVCDQLSC